MTGGLFSLIFISVAISAMAQTAFKVGVGRVVFATDAGVLAKAMALLFSPLVILGLALYGIGTILWLFALRHLDLSLAYPFVAMSFVLVALSGALVLGETLSLARIVGIGLICGGLVVMAFGR